MPLVCTILITLAALGVVFLVVLLACALDGFETWHNWRKFSRVLRELDTMIVSARKQADDRQHDVDHNVAHADEIPLGPCEHRDCPRKATPR